MNWRRLWRRLALLFLLGAVFISVIIARFLIEGGLFHVLAQRVPPTCSAIDLGGATFRDMAVDQTSGMLYVSTANAAEVIAAIMRVDLKAADGKLEPALAKAPTTFVPDAIGLFSVDGTRRLFAVNRAAPDRPSVEMFDFGDDGLWSHSANLRDTRFRDPADIAAVGPDSFYLANRPEAGNPFEAALEMVLGRSQGTLIYNNGERTTAAVIEMAGAGGVGVSPDGTTLYVAQTLARDVRTYTREPFLGSLTAGTSIKLPGAPRHLEVAPDGSLWIAADPHLGWSARQPAKAMPTQILHVQDPTGDAKVSESYVALDGSFAAGTVAVPFGNNILVIGSPVESRIHVCTLP